MGYDLIDDTYDQAGDTALRWSYAICSMPRCGSSLLSDGLHATGRLGVPIEYADPTDTLATLADRWGGTDLPSYLVELHRRRTGPNGVFGVKVHWFQLRDLAVELGGDEVGALARLAPCCRRMVHVHRRDRDRQAVSWARAEQSGVWGLGAGQDEGPSDEPTYDGVAIATCRALLDRGEGAWASLFEVVDIEVLGVAYEDLIANYPETIAEVAAFLGVAIDPAEVAAPRLRPQADEISEAHLARFRAEAVEFGELSR